MTLERRPRPPIDVLWCSSNHRGRANGWSFPHQVVKTLVAFADGRRVLQLFGGQSPFGLRLDIDRRVRPHVIGDAWLPPFVRDAFDVVIIDPPYVAINQQMKAQLLRAAAYIARDHVVWFHTQWLAADAKMRLERAWLVRVGDSCSVRCIQIFAVSPAKVKPRIHFTRGPALRYNHWLNGTDPLPFGERALEGVTA